jgi:hypothetical protein
MSDPKSDDAPKPAPARESRSIEASLRLSQLLARPLGSPPPPGETPYVPRAERLAAPKAPDAPADAPPDTTASVPEPPVETPPPAEAEPDLFEPLAPAPETVVEPAHDPGKVEEPSEPVADVWPRPRRRRPDESATPAAAAMPPAPEPSAPARVAAETPEPERAPPAAKPVDPDGARALAKIRRLMLLSNLFVLVAIGGVLAVVGYRISHIAPAAPPAPPRVVAPVPPPVPEMTLTLPRGARILQTAVSRDLLVITLQIDGAIEIRTYDLKTLKPAGRITFGGVP